MPAEPAPPPLLEATNLACDLGGRVLWQGLSMRVNAGERWAIAGPSGSGKTVLLRTLAALTPRQAGQLRRGGKPLEASHVPAWRASVVYLAQRPALPEGTVLAALAEPFGWHVHHGKAFAPDAARDWLAAAHVDLALLDQTTDRLSGGEAQLVALLRALLVAPDVLLLDEPTASLDPARTAAVEALVTRWLAAGPPRACVWTSHDAAQLARVSDRRITLGDPA